MTDTDFVEYRIEAVEQGESGIYSITFDGCCGISCGENCPVVPKVGDTVRLYGKGLGYRVRGLSINGVKVWHRTEAEDAEHSEIELYGADAADWLKRWDEGRGVWSIEMGGLGPGYEQAIQITVAELLRWLLQNTPNLEEWEATRDAMQDAAFQNETIKTLGLSGAQYGAATNLACQLYKRGPREIMKDERVKDRRIQVSKQFPVAA